MTIDTEQVRADIETAQRGWSVSRPWTTGDYAAHHLLFTVLPVLCDELDRYEQSGSRWENGRQVATYVRRGEG